MRLLADENLDGPILSGLFLRMPTIDLIRVQDVGFSARPDPEILEWAAANGRVMLSHDFKTMAKHAYERVDAGLPMPGVWLIPDWMQTGDVIEQVMIIVGCSLDGEWKGCVRYLPLW